MKMLKPVLVAIALAWAGAAAATTYLPVGPQTNVAVSTVTGGGWHECYSDTYFGTPNGTPMASILSTCDGEHLMLGAKLVGSDTLLLLAEALSADVTYNTGDLNIAGVTHIANGTEWYFSEGIGTRVTGAWGFAPVGSPVLLKSCDVKDTGKLGGGTLNLITGALRLCWQTDESKLTGGWRAGNAIFLTGDDAKTYERVIYTDAKVNSTVVPEPASWALMITGFGLVGGTLRRRGRVAA
jgi:hypothetical protein